jgi:hypothetical protein
LVTSNPEHVAALGIPVSLRLPNLIPGEGEEKKYRYLNWSLRLHGISEESSKGNYTIANQKIPMTLLLLILQIDMIRISLLFLVEMFEMWSQ